MASDLEVLSQQAVTDGLLTAEDFSLMQAKLWALLARRTERYTMNDSSSVRVETAEALFASILFSLRLYLKANPNDITRLKDESLEGLLHASWKELEMQIALGKRLLSRVTETAPQVGNISYHDTLVGIRGFFKSYDYRFFAHDIPCDIDYQLGHAVSEELEGIEYLNEYLRRLWFENEFCNLFDSQIMISLLEHYCSDYKGLLINLYEPVAINALGLSLLGESPFPLHISEAGREKLLFLFEGKSKQSGITLLSHTAQKLCTYFHITIPEQKEYLNKTATELYPRIEAALPSHNLSSIFLSLHS